MRTIGQPDLDPSRPLNLISGICLFGSAGLEGITADGQKVSLVDPTELEQLSTPIDQVMESAFVQPYEVEALLKIAEAINFMVTAQQQPSEVQLQMHVPTTEYKLYMLTLLERGVLTQSQFQELCVVIDRRADDLVAMLSKRLLPGIELQSGSPLAALDTLLKDPDVSAQNVLAASHNIKLVSQMIKKYGVGDDPLLMIPNFSYVAGYLLRALKAQQANSLCMAIDPVEEEPIYRHAKSTAKDFGLPADMVVMHVPPKVVTTTGRQENPALFKHKTADQHVLADLRTVLNIIANGG